MTTIAIELVMDDAHHHEFHREWVASQGPGLRSQKRVAIVLLAVGVGLGALDWATDGRQMTVTTITALVIAVFIFASLARRKHRWLKCVRALPWFGAAVRIEVHEGDLVQVKNSGGDPRFRRTGAIVPSPNGYFVKYRGLADESDYAVSATDASVYIPHRAITPPMSREAFLTALSAVEVQEGS